MLTFLLGCLIIYIMNTTDIYGKIIAAVLRMLNQMNRMEDMPKSFGTDVQIHPSEIHTIAVIGNRPGCNISELAEELGIAKPSATEIVQKIEAKKLVEKYKLPENKKEVRIKLTPKGSTAYKGHAEYHAEMYSKIYSHLKKLPEESLNEFKAALDNISSFLDAEIREESKGENR